MPKYRVTLQVTTTTIVEAANPFQATIVASERNGGGDEQSHGTVTIAVADTRPRSSVIVYVQVSAPAKPVVGV